MTQQSSILNDPNYRPVLDHGFVGIIDKMGTDAAIVQAARVSYGAGTKSVNEDRGLIRYLMRNFHTSPIEMVEIKYHIRAPIFVFRQLLRHRTASTNEESARYSEMTDEFYIPEMEHIQPQSSDNRQGRAGEVSSQSATGVRWMIDSAYNHCYQIYRALLGDKKNHVKPEDELLYNPYDAKDPLFDGQFDGIARELARTVMPVGGYSELYWKINLHNLFHFLKLRADAHAQYEIRAYAEAIIDLTKPLFPLAFGAFEDYLLHAQMISRMGMNLIKDAITHPEGLTGLTTLYGDEKGLASHYEMSLREIKELKMALLTN